MGDDPFVPVGNNNSTAHGIQINNVGKTSIILLACFAGLALGVSLGTVAFMVSENNRLMAQMRETEREVRMLEYYVNRLDATMVEHGIKKPGDDYQSQRKE